MKMAAECKKVADDITAQRERERILAEQKKHAADEEKAVKRATHIINELPGKLAKCAASGQYTYDAMGCITDLDKLVARVVIDWAQDEGFKATIVTTSHSDEGDFTDNLIISW